MRHSRRTSRRNAKIGETAQHSFERKNRKRNNNHRREKDKHKNQVFKIYLILYSLIGILVLYA